MAQDNDPAPGYTPDNGANDFLANHEGRKRSVFSVNDPINHDYNLHVEQWNDDEVDDGTQDDLIDPPRFSKVFEWFNCLMFDVILLILEAGVSIWLALSLYANDLITEYRTILIVLALPSFINPLLWLKIKFSKSDHDFYYKKMGTCFVFGLLFVSFNSPIFVYVWHLYLSALGSRQNAANWRKLANTFRMVQAIVTSVSLIMLNSTSVWSRLKSIHGGSDVLDLSLLSDRLYEVKIHEIAFFISFFNLIRAASLFNERQTFSILFSVVSLPFAIFTIYSRLEAFAFIAAFLEVQWVAALFVMLFLVNILLYVLCRKQTKVAKKDSVHRQIQGIANFESTLGSETDEDLIQKSVPSGSFWLDLPKVLAMSIGSIIVPIGYTNDFRMHHMRIKGGVFLIANYISHMILIGAALGYTIEHNTPVFMPTINQAALRSTLAIVVPIVLAIFCLPFTVMRASMMELDWFVAYKKDLDSLAGSRRDKGKMKNKASDFLTETVLENYENPKLKWRINISLCCNALGTIVYTLFIIMVVAAIVLLAILAELGKSSQ